jgi:hypothetical protein
VIVELLFISSFDIVVFH